MKKTQTNWAAAMFFLAVVMTAIPSRAEDGISFAAKDLAGNTVKLSQQETNQLTAVCFLGTECPLAKLYAGRLNRLADKFDSVRFIGIASNQQDSVADLNLYVQRQALSFPLVKDSGNVIADQFSAERTPEVFLVNQKLQILYRGRIDDQYQPGVAKSKPNRDDLEIAISEGLSGKPITVTRTQPQGCLIGRVKKESDPTSTITYTNQISRLLQNHCSECHRTGEIGPMRLDEFSEVKGWADMIVEVVDDNRMPPWHADPAHGDFTNERRMTQAEKKMLKDWVAAGTPEGDPKLLPANKEYAKTKWNLPKQPDVVFPMRSKPFRVPAEGTVDYQYFVVDPKFKEDKWVTAAEILPGDRSVLHHTIVFVRPPDGRGGRGIGWLASYVPGQSLPTFNPKMGRYIPAGSKLVFQQHYTPTGKPAEDLTRIGMVFGDESQIEHQVYSLIALNQEFVIPPGDSNFRVSAKFPWLPKDAKLMALSPHMHFRGKSARVIAKYDDQKNKAPKDEETLLNVPEYDFNWQHIYQLRKPIPISQFKEIEIEIAFDNSSSNPANPDATEHVSWGDQTWEEMALMYAIVSQPRNPQRVVTQPTAEEKAAAVDFEKRLNEKVTAFVDDYFERFDKNGDNEIRRGIELPRSVRVFGAWEFDSDRNGSISREELTKFARQRLASKLRRNPKK